MLEPPTNPPLASVTSRVPKSNVQLAPGLGGVTVAFLLTVQALAVHDAQQDMTSAAVQTAAACRAEATSRTSAAAASARFSGTLPSCRCDTE